MLKADSLDRGVLKTLTKLSAIQFLRMSGVFFIIPVLAVYSERFTDSGILIGLSLGAYEISMALMQIPSGRLSDKFGRIPVILFGLLLFIVGNSLSYLSSYFNGIEGIYILIISRFIAGTGAISTPLTSLSQEMVPDNRKNTAMAIMGVGIGLSFLLGTAFSPIISSLIQIQNMFLISIFLGIAAFVSMLNVREYGNGKIAEKLKLDKHVLRVSMGAFLFSVAGFIIIYSNQVYFTFRFGLFNYGVILFISVLISGAISIYISEAYARRKNIRLIPFASFLMIGGIVILFAGFLEYISFPVISVFLICYYTGFSLYEISAVPAITGKIRRENYGSSIGIFYSMQFIGNGIGALIGGSLAGVGNMPEDYALPFIIALVLSIISTLILWPLSKTGNDSYNPG